MVYNENYCVGGIVVFRAFGKGVQKLFLWIAQAMAPMSRVDNPVEGSPFATVCAMTSMLGFRPIRGGEGSSCCCCCRCGLFCGSFLGGDRGGGADGSFIDCGSGDRGSGRDFGDCDLTISMLSLVLSRSRIGGGGGTGNPDRVEEVGESSSCMGFVGRSSP